MASVVESQSTASSEATDTSTTGLLARQPPIGIETAAATNPTLIRTPSLARPAAKSRPAGYFASVSYLS